METTAVLAPGLLPHQHHRAVGTVKKTEAHIARVKAAHRRERTKASSRSPKWAYFRTKLLVKHRAAGKGCEACGSKVGLQLHHIVPFNVNPKRELDPTNIIVLCEFVGGLECHELLGHGDNWKRYNPRIREDAAALMADPKKLSEIRASARKNRVLNAPPRAS